MSWCSRRPPPRWTRWRGWCGARWKVRRSSAFRWWWTSAWGRTGWMLSDSGRRGRKRGLVLVDALLLLVAVALLLAVGVPELTAARRRSAQTALRSDLRRLAAAQGSDFFYRPGFAPRPPG